jgi:cytochrome c oxidase subunit 3
VSATHVDVDHDHPVQHTFHPYKGGMNPNVLGLIIFLVSELALFGSFFLYYAHQRAVRGYEWPPADFHIPADLTSINTAVLVLSSFTCEFALISLLRKNRTGLLWGLIASAVLGAVFLGLQVREYLEIGFTPQDEAVGAAFFSLTGLHGAHVFVGLLLLTFCIIRTMRGHFSPEAHPGLLGTSIYWHFVDVVWVILYTLVYLLPTHVH